MLGNLPKGVKKSVYHKRGDLMNKIPATTLRKETSRLNSQAEKSALFTHLNFPRKGFLLSSKTKS